MVYSRNFQNLYHLNLVDLHNDHRSSDHRCANDHLYRRNGHHYQKIDDNKTRLYALAYHRSDKSLTYLKIHEMQFL
ncbi:hypothetical protein HanPI659440_Chr11g0423641 [Helianthus annuus]|nr:hypothetical protein HanPI659440_Chr11g0423641 [Helianthus annuus]